MSQLKKPLLLDPQSQPVISERVMTLNVWADHHAKNSKQKVIKAGMGKPTYPLDECISESMLASWEQIRSSRCALDYALPPGDEASRIKMADALTRLYHFDETHRITENNILFTSGGSLALASIFMAINSEIPDGRIITTLPYYPLHKGFNGKNRLHPINLMSLPGYRLTSLALKSKILSAKKLAFEDKHPISAFVFCYPNNPTGIVLSEEEWKELADVLTSDSSLKNIPIILDESYAELSMTKPHCSLLTLAPELEDRIIVLRSATKSFSGAGLRMAVVICKNPALLSRITAVHTYLAGHADRVTAKAYADAMYEYSRDPQNHPSHYYQKIVQKVGQTLEDIGAAMPDASYRVEGTFYYLADLSDLIGTEMCPNQAFPSLTQILDDECLVYHLLFDQGVMVAPFSYFGGHAKKGIVRITCTDMDDSMELLSRLEALLAKVREIKSQACLETIINHLASTQEEFSDYYRAQIEEIITEKTDLEVSPAKRHKIILERLKDLFRKITDYQKWKSLIRNQLKELEVFEPELANSLETEYIYLLKHETDPAIIMQETEFFSKMLRDSIAKSEWKRWNNLIYSDNITDVKADDRNIWKKILHSDCSYFEKNTKAHMLTLNMAKYQRSYQAIESEIEIMPSIPFDIMRFNQTIWNRIGHELTLHDLGKARTLSHYLFIVFTPLWDQALTKSNTIATVVAGPVNSFLVTESGETFVCGSNKYQNTGLSRFCRFQLTWNRLNINTVRTVVAGYDSTILLTTKGKAYGCGRNGCGELGFPHKKPVNEMTLLETIEDVTALTATKDFGSNTVCLTKRGNLLSAGGGIGIYGSLDLGWKLLPTLENVYLIAAGRSFLIALTRDHRAFGFGRIGIFIQNSVQNNHSHFHWHEFLPGIKINKIAATEDAFFLYSENGCLYHYFQIAPFQSWLKYAEANNIVSPIVRDKLDIVEMTSSNDCVVIRTQAGDFYTSYTGLLSNLTNIPKQEDFFFIDTLRLYKITKLDKNIRSISIASYRCLALTQNQELRVCGINCDGELGLNHRSPQQDFTRSNFNRYPVSQGFFSKRTITHEELLAQRARVFNRPGEEPQDPEEFEELVELEELVPAADEANNAKL